MPHSHNKRAARKPPPPPEPPKAILPSVKVGQVWQCRDQILRCRVLTVGPDLFSGRYYRHRVDQRIELIGTLNWTLKAEWTAPGFFGDQLVPMYRLDGYPQLDPGHLCVLLYDPPAPEPTLVDLATRLVM